MSAVYRSRRFGLLCMVLALAAAACSSGSSEASDDQTLAAFFGYDDQDEEDWEAQWRDQEAQVQELIRTCMAEQGFEYIPVDQTSGSVVVYDEEDEEQRVRKEGFGITTWYGDMDADFEVPFDEEGVLPDPNWERMESMSDSEREAYEEALFGGWEDSPAVDYDPETGEEVLEDFGWGGGCQGEAQEAVYDGEMNQDDQDLWEQLEPAYEALMERVQADPRIVEWNEKWASCMAAAGFDYESPDKMQEVIWSDYQARLDEILGPDAGFVDPFEGWSEADIEAFFEENTEDEIDAFFQAADSQGAANIDQEALAALQQEEIDLAVADFECRGGGDAWELHQEVSESYEAQFIAENRELLERLRDLQQD